MASDQEESLPQTVKKQPADFIRHEAQGVLLQPPARQREHLDLVSVYRYPLYGKPFRFSEFPPLVFRVVASYRSIGVGLNDLVKRPRAQHS